MNNFQYIKSMNIDELTKFISCFAAYIGNCDYCPIEHFCECKSYGNEGLTCADVIKLWLESEMKDECR